MLNIIKSKESFYSSEKASSSQATACHKTAKKRKDTHPNAKNLGELTESTSDYLLQQGKKWVLLSTYLYICKSDYWFTKFHFSNCDDDVNESKSMNELLNLCNFYEDEERIPDIFNSEDELDDSCDSKNSSFEAFTKKLKEKDSQSSNYSEMGLSSSRLKYSLKIVSQINLGHQESLKDEKSNAEICPENKYDELELAFKGIITGNVSIPKPSVEENTTNNEDEKEDFWKNVVF